MFAALALSFAVIFVAELGDKSQLMAMTFALRYRWWVVLTAILTATTLVHAASVFLGHFLGLSIPTELMSIVGGLAMLVFGLWTVRGDELDDDEASRAGRVGRSVFLAVMSSFLLAELGDKTMLATIALAADHDWLGVWIGSTIGMVAADALAIIVGRTLGRHLPERTIALGAAVLFFGFAVWLIADGLAGASALVTAFTIVGALVITAGGVLWIIATNRRRAAEAAARAEIDETADAVTQSTKQA
ncbi:MAG: TMEM165/GDT1 family protein [Gordonia sp. (in: high G+C Gram-positive bacteria)]|jgi:putative Ca2+/H+ antiporter (TMEM165/GDT1 family)|nr:TMEM165/GDT1 family protein [Gordonia sp. (in: high G+C Gram-positive bacteria)]